jgi:hypothetical protein
MSGHASEGADSFLSRATKRRVHSASLHPCPRLKDSRAEKEGGVYRIEPHDIVYVIGLAEWESGFLFRNKWPFSAEYANVG